MPQVQKARGTSASARKRGSPASIGRGKRGARASSNASFDPADTTLTPYFGALQALPLLERAEELALAREIDRLVVGHWQVLLAYRPARATIALAIEPCLPGCSSTLASFRARRGSARTDGGSEAVSKRASNATLIDARKLRALDASGAALRAARSAVLDRFGGEPSAREYVARIGRAHAAEQAVKARFVTANLRLVIAMAKRYEHKLLPLADLIQEGNVGLLRAVEGFDHRRGYRFSTYAAWWIRQGMTRALSDKGRLVRIPVHALEDLARVARASGAIAARTGSAPDPEELAALTGLAPETVAALSFEGLTKHAVSLDRGVGQDGERSLHDSLPDITDRSPDDDLALASWRTEVDRLLARLSPIEADTLRLRFGLRGEELTLREVGDKYNLSRERIRQIQADALCKLRALLEPVTTGGAGENARAA